MLRNKNTLNRVIDCLATTTRYPKELLTADAELENGLGIDSVKRMEFLLVLEEEFSIDLQQEPYDSSLRTINDVANWLENLLGEQSPEPSSDPPAPAPTPEPQANNGASHRTSPAESLAGPHYRVYDRAAGAMTSGPAGQRAFLPDRPHKPLAGRVALVTGAGRGIGRTIARLLAARGAMVLVNSFHSRERGEATVADIQAQGGSAAHLWGSVANPVHVDEMFDIIEQQYGLDILICNASDGRIGSFLELTSDDWDRAFRTNVAGHHHCAKRAARIMRAGGGGAMVTMSAVGAHQHIEGLGSQGVVKAAVESMTRYLAFALSGSGIRVNCVAGGPVYGELLDKFPAAQAAQSHWEAMTPDGELCTPMDLAQAIAFLVSDEARGINGAVWMVDHGFSATAEGQRWRCGAASTLPSPSTHASHSHSSLAGDWS